MASSRVNKIPSVTVDGSFTWDGKKLLYEEHARESPAQLRKLLLPVGDQDAIGDRDMPKSWWLAQVKFYGLTGSKATPIGTLRSKLEEALRERGGMKVSDKIRTLEAEGSQKYQERLELAQKDSGRKRSTGGSDPKGKGASKKRSRSPVPEAARKRARTNDDSGFEWLAGTYTVTKADVLKGWPECKFEKLKLVIRLDSDKKMFASFHFYVVQGVMRSTINIQSRPDGALASIEWCGEVGEGFDGTPYPPTKEMKGALRFTRKPWEGHIIEGVLKGVDATGKNIEFTAERTGRPTAQKVEWEEYLAKIS